MSADVRLLSSREACRELGISAATLRAAVDAGRIPTVDLGGRARFSLLALRSWQQRQGELVAERSEPGAP
jgi:excisionase family DNA binding protein